MRGLNQGSTQASIVPRFRDQELRLSEVKRLSRAAHLPRGKWEACSWESSPGLPDPLDKATETTPWPSGASWQSPRLRLLHVLCPSCHEKGVCEGRCRGTPTAGGVPPPAS